MGLASKEIRDELDKYMKIYDNEIGTLPHHKINVADSYSEALIELQTVAKENNVPLSFVGFARLNEKNKNEATYLQVIPLEDVSLEGIKKVVDEKLKSLPIRGKQLPHFIYGIIDPKSKGNPTYNNKELADVVAISKYLGEAFSTKDERVLVDISGQKISGDGFSSFIRYNDIESKNGIGFFGEAGKENVHSFGYSEMGGNDQ